MPITSSSGTLHKLGAARNYFRPQRRVLFDGQNRNLPFVFWIGSLQLRGKARMVPKQVTP